MNSITHYKLYEYCRNVLMGIGAAHMRAALETNQSYVGIHWDQCFKGVSFEWVDTGKDLRFRINPADHLREYYSYPFTGLSLPVVRKNGVYRDCRNGKDRAKLYAEVDEINRFIQYCLFTPTLEQLNNICECQCDNHDPTYKDGLVKTVLSEDGKWYCEFCAVGELIGHEYVKLVKPSRSSSNRDGIPSGLRFDILTRDGYRCCLCGRSAQDGAKLHVDHIHPVAKGGKTEPDNLQTLCAKCNLGKSDKIIELPGA